MSTPLQASALQKAPTTAGITTGAAGLTSGAKPTPLNGLHATAPHTASYASGTASTASTYVSKASESVASTHYHENRTTSSDISVKHKSTHESVSSICLSEEQKHILNQGTCSLGDALSQVPWMKFRLVAEPNMDIFASDKRLRTFIHEITQLTVSIVTKQCNEEIAVLIKKLTSSLSYSMEERVQLIMKTVIEQISALCLEDTMTACQNLGEIKEKVCFGSRYDHHRHDTYGDHHHHDSDKHHHHHDTEHHHHHEAPYHTDSKNSYDSSNSDKYKRTNGVDHEKPKPIDSNKSVDRKLSTKSTPVKST